MQRDPRRGPGASRTDPEIIAAVAMLENPGDERGFGDRGDNTHLCAASSAEPQIDIEHPAHDPRDGGGRAKQEARAESLHPTHRGSRFGLAGLPFAIVFGVRRGR